jgi:NitT/TauT family transport system substrate-binding protein
MRFKQFILLLGLISWSVSGLTKTYKLGLVEWIPWSTAYVAQQQGFWQTAGIDVVVKQFANYETENLKAFENQKTDFMLSMLGNAVEMINRSPKYVIIYEHDWSHGGDLFILHQSLSSLEQVKGGKIGVYTRSAPIRFFIKQVLDQAQININEVKLVEIANTHDLNQAFKKGKLAAIVSYDPEASRAIKEKVGQLLFTSADFPGVIPEGISVQKDILEQHPEVVKKFLQGWLRAVQWQADPNNKPAFYALLRKTMFRKQSHTDAELDAFHTGGKLHIDLDTILTRNQQGAPTYIKELLLYLQQTGQPLRSLQPQDYIQTQIAITEAQAIFK